MKVSNAADGDACGGGAGCWQDTSKATRATQTTNVDTRGKKSWCAMQPFSVTPLDLFDAFALRLKLRAPRAESRGDTFPAFD